MSRLGAGAVILLAAGLAALLLFAPEPRPARATHLCGDTGSPLGPFDLETYEAEDWRTTYGRTLELAGFNQLFPEVPGFALPELERGPRSAGSGQLSDPYIPPTLLKAIAWIESTWVQADWSVPYGGVGPVLVSHDCGYGIMQVTTGMQNITGVPNLDQAMIGGHFGFNIARGARILADKWNLAPEYRPQVADRDPAIFEDWYYAVWGYNGFAFTNHPLNPDYSLTRAPYRCDGTQSRSSYPYQELVFGCVVTPPVVGDTQLWSPREAHLPDFSDPAFAGPLSLDNWDSCAFSLQCAAMDIPRPNPWHLDPTTPGADRAQVIGNPVLSVSSANLSLLAPPGGQAEALSVTISNGGGGVLAWRVSPSASWLKVSRLQGVSLGADLGAVSGSFSVWADASSLEPGVYTAQVTVESLYAGGAPAVIDVTLYVSAMHHWLLHTGTPLEETTGEQWSFATADFDGDGWGDLIGVKMNGTGCGKTEVHVLSGGSGFQEWSLHACTPLEITERDRWSFAAGDWDRDGVPDLIGVKKNSTGCSRTEVHVLSGAANFTQWLVHTCTALHEIPAVSDQWMFGAGDFDGDGVPDLVAIMMNGTGCGRTEAHVMSGAANFDEWLLHGCTSLGAATNSDRTFGVGDYDGDGRSDLYAVQMSNTGTGSTEVHVLSAASNYEQFALQSGSALHMTAPEQWAFSIGRSNQNDSPDLVAIKMNGTGTASTEVHVLGW